MKRHKTHTFPVSSAAQAPSRSRRDSRGFALVLTLILMALITLLAVGMLGLASIELRKSSNGMARAVAMENARLGLALALGQLQKDLGSDRRITADASILASTKNPAAVGVWTGWSPDMVSKSLSNVRMPNYDTPKKQEIPAKPDENSIGFRGWLVSQPDPKQTRRLDWHTSAPAGDDDASTARLFVNERNGFDLNGGKIPVSAGAMSGTTAWAVTQENTRAKINLGVEDEKRADLTDRLQAPARPNLAVSSLLNQPEDNQWRRRPATIAGFSQAVLDPAYGADRDRLGLARAHFTAESRSLLTNAVKGGLKADLSTGFEMSEQEFSRSSWSDTWGSVQSPFRSTEFSAYQGQKPLFRPFPGTESSAEIQIKVPFNPATVTHKYQANGVPTFDALRAHYRAYRHLYLSGGEPTAFERPYSHIASPKISGRPFGEKSHPSLMPVLDRMNLTFSVLTKSDGTPCIMLSPLITVWNPHNVAIETEGLVAYPWLDFPLRFFMEITESSTGTVHRWNGTSGQYMGRLLVEDRSDGHNRTPRPYFYFHLTETGNPVAPRARNISPAIRLAPGEVKVFCMVPPDGSGIRADHNRIGAAAVRSYRMKAVTSPSDITASLKNGIVLNMSQARSTPFTYKMKTGDKMKGKVRFDLHEYLYVTCMTDAWQIKNPNVELMPDEQGHHYYSQVYAAATATGAGNGNQVSFNFPEYTYADVREKPTLIGTLLTYHRTARSASRDGKSLVQSDLMFTVNPRQTYANRLLAGYTESSKNKALELQAAPHYESVLFGGASLAQIAMETTPDGRQAFYGASHSWDGGNGGKSYLPLFEIPRGPTLSLAAFQHCDLGTTPYGNPTQVGNSWASPYLPATSVARTVTSTYDTNDDVDKIRTLAISGGLAFYDMSYLANEALFDSFFLSGATPEQGAWKNGTGTPAIWGADQISDRRSLGEVLEAFFTDAAEHPLRNPRMLPHHGSLSPQRLRERLEGPSGCARIAAHLLVDGGFNINSTSVEAWSAVLASLRNIEPSPSNESAQSRFRHVLTGAPVGMEANGAWSFRTLKDEEIRLLASRLVEEIKTRGPFLSLGEFVNRRLSADSGMNSKGAIQAAIDKSSLNGGISYAPINRAIYPNPENLQYNDTGTNIPGWLNQADVLHALAPFITVRSDTFVIRSQGEALDKDGKVLSRVSLEAVVQRIPDWIDSRDDAAIAVADLRPTNRTFGRRFEIIHVRELHPDELNRG